MGWDRDEELLTDYAQWVAQLKIKGVDQSPQAYLVDSAKNEAFNRVVKAGDYVKTVLKSEEIDAHVAEHLLDILEGDV